jgi:hypothetical protein
MQEKSDKPVKKNRVLFQVRAMFDFDARDQGELRLVKGDIIDVHDSSTFPEWFVGTKNGQVGIFPSNYVEKLNLAFEPPSEADGDFLTVMSKTQLLKQYLQKADPLGLDKRENENVKVLLLI